MWPLWRALCLAARLPLLLFCQSVTCWLVKKFLVHRCVQACPLSPAAHSALGLVELARGAPKEAAACFELAEELLLSAGAHSHVVCCHTHAHASWHGTPGARYCLRGQNVGVQGATAQSSLLFCRHTLTAGGYHCPAGKGAGEDPVTVLAPADGAAPADPLARVRLNRARALALAGDHAAAAAAYGRLEAAGQLQGQPAAWLCYAHALAGSGAAAQAEAVALRALEDDPPAKVECFSFCPSKSQSLEDACHVILGLRNCSKVGMTAPSGRIQIVLRLRPSMIP